MKDPLQMLAEDRNVYEGLRLELGKVLFGGGPAPVSPAIGEFAIQDAHRLRAALESIAALNAANTDSGEGMRGEAICFHLAQAIARAALAPETKA